MRAGGRAGGLHQDTELLPLARADNPQGQAEPSVTNQRPVFWTPDLFLPIRGQYSGHVISESDLIRELRTGLSERVTKRFGLEFGF